MANSSLGAALTIPKSALDAIEQADKKLKDIQDTAKNTAALEKKCTVCLNDSFFIYIF